MLRQFVYPADVERDEAGYFLVTFPDFPEAGTDGETLEEALAAAADCLAEAVAGRIARTENIPKVARKQKGQYAIAIPAQIAAKAALYLAMKEASIDKSDLARRLGRDVKEVRHLLDPKQPSDIQHIEEALAAIGQELVVGVQASAAV
ncbi:MAG TPA: type II toxin-antitoxin system HicB family antitoxin [Candidatus Binatia bacterium]|nr:type II toxin-antitoxin system HicB family antitoxin [Candidatus Binatia bacterium]